VTLKIKIILRKHKYNKTVSSAFGVLFVVGLINCHYISHSSSWQPCKPFYQCTKRTLPITAFWINV